MALKEEMYHPGPTVILEMVRDVEGGIASDLFSRLTLWIADIVAAVFKAAVGFLASIVQWLYEEIAQPLVESDLIPEELRDDMRRFTESPDLSSVFVAIAVAVASVMAKITTWFAIFGEAHLQEARTENPIEIPGPGELITMLNRRIIYDSDALDAAARLGVSNEWFQRLRQAALVYPDPELSRQMFLRGEIDEATHDAWLSALGYTTAAIKAAKVAYRWIPGPQDLIRMSVREAFDPEYIKRYGTMAAYPAEFDTWLQQTGGSTYWGQKFWAAHWELPSIQMGFEMLHRAIIDRDDLDNLLHALDIMPWWRERLLAMSYRPLTRVDVRRMHDLGVLTTNEEVTRAYEDLGYNRLNAERMTDFTIRYNAQLDRDLTKGEVIRGYKEKILTQSEAHSLLRDLGYSLSEAGYLTALEDIREQQELEELVFDRIRYWFVQGSIDSTTALGQLGELGIPAARADLLIKRWQIDRDKQRKIPSRQDWLTWLQLGLVDENTVKNELYNLGYSWKHCDLYIAATKKGAEVA